MSSSQCSPQKGSARDSDSSVGGGGCRAPREVGAKKSQQVFNSLVTSQKARDSENNIQDIVSACRENPELQVLVRACIQKYNQSKAPEQLKRGVRSVGSLPTKYLPMLMNAMTGVDESTFSNMPPPDLRALFFYALGVPDSSYKLPATNMYVSEVAQWCHDKYTSMGQVLEGVPTVAFSEGVNWETGMGVFKLGFDSDSPGPDDRVTKVTHTRMGKVIELPSEICVKHSDLESGAVFVKDNYAHDTALLVRDSTGVTIPLGRMFQDRPVGKEPPCSRKLKGKRLASEAPSDAQAAKRSGAGPTVARNASEEAAAPPSGDEVEPALEGAGGQGASTPAQGGVLPEGSPVPVLLEPSP